MANGLLNEFSHFCTMIENSPVDNLLEVIVDNLDAVGKPTSAVIELLDYNFDVIEEVTHKKSNAIQ